MSKRNIRQELAHDIPTWEDLPFGGGNDYVKLDANAANAVASVLIEKGWTKPRIVKTAAEMDALPVGSVIVGLSIGHDIDCDAAWAKPHPYIKSQGEDGLWFSAIDWDGYSAPCFFWPGNVLPTVLHEGGDQ